MFPEHLPNSEHFPTSELIRSSEATKHNIPNTPPDALLPNAERLVLLAEEARKILALAFGCEIHMILSSGYRCPALNTRAGGSGSRPGEKPSAHMDFRAIDFDPRGVSVSFAFDILRKSALAYDKIILETDGNTFWIHLQVAREGEVPARRAFTGIKMHGGQTFKEVK